VFAGLRCAWEIPLCHDAFSAVVFACVAGTVLAAVRWRVGLLSIPPARSSSCAFQNVGVILASTSALNDEISLVLNTDRAGQPSSWPHRFYPSIRPLLLAKPAPRAQKAGGLPMGRSRCRHPTTERADSATGAHGGRFIWSRCDRATQAKEAAAAFFSIARRRAMNPRGLDFRGDSSNAGWMPGCRPLGSQKNRNP